ncbi:MAG: aldehyde dehydrogenase family protein, partial [Dyella sp.]|nr:aldehyde dehydrogenase family protein [Dyella sp.]
MHAQHFVANRLIAPDSGLRIKVFDPSSGEPFAEIARGNATDISVAVHAARKAADGVWGAMAPADRVRLLNRVALTLIEHEDELAALEARDTGKPLRQARGDARAVARYFEFYAGAVDKLHGQTIP